MYLNVSLASLKKEFSYRVHFLSTLVSSVGRLAVFWFLWTAIYKFSATGVIQGFTFMEMITYSSISTIITYTLTSWLEFFVEEDIKTGRISNILTKPVNYVVFRVYDELGRILFKILTRVIPLSLVAFLLMGISLPSSPLFFFSAVISLFINICISLLVGMWAIMSKGSIWGMSKTVDAVSEIMSGSLIPLYFLPAWFASIAYVLPFQAVYNIPISIYLGKMAGYEAFIGLGIQLAWLAVLIVVVHFVWKYSERKIMVFGG
jgi:ABC-2 type transport system permease protein